MAFCEELIMNHERNEEKWTSGATLPLHDSSFIRFTLFNLLLLILIFVFAFVSGLFSSLTGISVGTVVYFVFVLNAIILFVQAIFILVKITRLIKQKKSGRGLKIIVSLCFLAALYPSLQISAMILGMNDLLFGSWAIGG
jgi:hypothetical protein